MVRREPPGVLVLWPLGKVSHAGLGQPLPFIAQGYLVGGTKQSLDICCLCWRANRRDFTVNCGWLLSVEDLR